MSKVFNHKLKCHECGTESDFMLWESINTQLDPEAKKKLISGELLKFRCPHCGFESLVQYGTLYHDMEKKTMIRLVVTDTDYDETVSTFDKMSKGSFMEGIPGEGFSDYTLRIVMSQNHLREKAYIFDQGLDDRVIEVMKCRITEMYEKSYPDEEVAALWLEPDENGPKRFTMILKDADHKNTNFSRELYDIIREEMFNGPDDDRHEYFVDEEWAKERLGVPAG